MLIYNPEFREEYLAKISAYMQQWDIQEYKVLNDGSVNASGIICLNGQLKQIGGFPFKFHKIEGDLEIHFNDLTELINMPDIVTGRFSCRNNQLHSLKGTPQQVSSLICSHNKLDNLMGCPDTLSNLDASNNPLKNLNGIATTIKNTLDLSMTTLTSFEGAENTSCFALDMGANQIKDLSVFLKDVHEIYAVNSLLTKEDLMLLPHHILAQTRMMGSVKTEDLRAVLEKKQLHEKLSTELNSPLTARRGKI